MQQQPPSMEYIQYLTECIYVFIFRNNKSWKRGVGVQILSIFIMLNSWEIFISKCECLNQNVHPSLAV